MRDHTLLGPAKVSASIAIPRQANPAADSNLPFFKSYTIRSDGKLPAIQQRGLHVPWQQWCKQDKGAGLRASCYKVAQGIQHKRIGTFMSYSDDISVANMS